MAYLLYSSTPLGTDTLSVGPVFGVFQVLDHYAQSILRYFPIYYMTKILVLYWLSAKDGALLVYRRLMRPLLIKYGGLDTSRTPNGQRTPY